MLVVVVGRSGRGSGRDGGGIVVRRCVAGWALVLVLVQSCACPSIATAGGSGDLRPLVSDTQTRPRHRPRQTHTRGVWLATFCAQTVAVHYICGMG